MGIQHRITSAAARQLALITRSQLLEMGVDDAFIGRRLSEGSWTAVHPGVYLPRAVRPSWEQRLMAATLATCHGVVSHRAAAALWQLDGFGRSPIELTVPYGKGPEVEGVVLHRTRRPIEIHHRGRIPVTGVARTLIDVGRFAPSIVVARGLEDALKRRLVSQEQMWTCIGQEGGRRVPGAHVVRSVLARRSPGPAAGSPAEVMFIRMLRRYAIPEPERQYRLRLRNGAVYVVDFAWPRFRVAVEFDGLGKRWDKRALDEFLTRQNDILDAGWTLRRFGWLAMTERPEDTARRIRLLLQP